MIKLYREELLQWRNRGSYHLTIPLICLCSLLYLIIALNLLQYLVCDYVTEVSASYVTKYVFSISLEMMDVHQFRENNYHMAKNTM